MANSSDNKKVPSSTPSKGNKGNLAAGLAGALPKPVPRARRTTDSEREDDPRLVREAFGKRRHKRGWCSL